jgi:hypothetical protein
MIHGMPSTACDRTTPDEVVIRDEPRRHVTDPTLGIPVELPPLSGTPKHRLVTIGDSISHGFMSAAIYRTDVSWPAIVAYELGLSGSQFRFPVYERADGPGGLPLDLERFARAFEKRFGPKLDFWELPSASIWLQRYLDAIEDYWERGPGAATPPRGAPFHAMAVYGWDVLDATQLTADSVAKRIGTPKDDLFEQVVQDDQDRAALVVLQKARDSGGKARTVLQAAAAMSAERGGLETLVVALGANNALGSVVELKPCWSAAGYDTMTPSQRLKAKRAFSVWRPSHFAADWALLERELRKVRARHVIIATVPAVTIAPIARGVGGKVSPESRYFPYYTRPWITDEDFDPGRDPHITEDEARAIDSAIDAYNETIIASVERARRDGLDWLLFDMGALLDRLATRRYVASPWARPPWWEPYELPAELRALDPVPNTRFFRSGPQGRTDGGLFSLDGVHPTTIGYGLLAQEVIAVMERAGVEFRGRDGTLRPSPVRVDVTRVLETDTLIQRPPAAVSPTLSLLGWLDERLDWVRRLLPFTSW